MPREFPILSKSDNGTAIGKSLYRFLYISNISSPFPVILILAGWKGWGRKGENRENIMPRYPLIAEFALQRSCIDIFASYQQLCTRNILFSKYILFLICICYIMSYSDTSSLCQSRLHSTHSFAQCDSKRNNLDRHPCEYIAILIRQVLCE